MHLLRIYTFPAGTSPTEDGTIIPYPYDGKHYNYHDPLAPVLGRFEGEDLLLHLPPGLTVEEIRWLSVWCRAFTVNFGEVVLPEEGEDEAADLEAGVSIEVLRGRLFE